MSRASESSYEESSGSSIAEHSQDKANKNRNNASTGQTRFGNSVPAIAIASTSSEIKADIKDNVSNKSRNNKNNSSSGKFTAHDTQGAGGRSASRLPT